MKRSIAKPLVKDKQVLSYLTARGVPEGVLYSPFPVYFEPLISRIMFDPDKSKHKEVPVAKQVAHFKKTIDDPFGSNYLMCIAGLHHDALALQVALKIFVTAVGKNTSNEKPFWHTVYGGTFDSLRDASPGELRNTGNPSLLVLSNLATNSTTIKIEKARDLLVRYMKVPRIVVVGGENPIDFCSRVLAMHVNRVIYFGAKDI